MRKTTGFARHLHGNYSFFFRVANIAGYPTIANIHLIVALPIKCDNGTEAQFAVDKALDVSSEEVVGKISPFQPNFSHVLLIIRGRSQPIARSGSMVEVITERVLTSPSESQRRP